MIVLWNLVNLRDNEQNLRSPKNHEDHIAGKGSTSMTHYNLVHKFIPMPPTMNIPDAKAAEQTHILVKVNLSCTFLKTTKP